MYYKSRLSKALRVWGQWPLSASIELLVLKGPQGRLLHLFALLINVLRGLAAHSPCTVEQGPCAH